MTVILCYICIDVFCAFVGRTIFITAYSCDIYLKIYRIVLCTLVSCNLCAYIYTTTV